MATQYTAGITQGQVWSADIANQIGAAWETWTPTISSNAGTITTSVLNGAKYARIQKTVFAWFDVSITTAGTAAGNYLVLTLPITARTTLRNIGSAREINATGNLCGCDAVNTTQVWTIAYNNGGVIQNGYRIAGSITYEAA